MTAEVNSLIMLAQLNEAKGFYRRALRIWQEISTSFLADREQCHLAREKINDCNLQLQMKSTSEIAPCNSKKKDVERDKIKIRQLLRQGYSIKEIQHMTGRSSAFIYKYNPRGKSIR
ncbi:MAG: PerC family transcriptional regulator [Kluyvera sp.]